MKKVKLLIVFITIFISIQSTLPATAQEPNKRFATPEATWDFYRSSLSRGDIQSAISCHIPFDTKYSGLFNELGPKKVKQIGHEMGSIEKIISDSSKAKYRLKRQENGMDITYYVYFVQINGEWKIEKY